MNHPILTEKMVDELIWRACVAVAHGNEKRARELVRVHYPEASIRILGPNLRALSSIPVEEGES